MDISKKDWKLFRERLSGWQENYMEGLVKEYANFLNDDKKPAWRDAGNGIFRGSDRAVF